MEKGMLDACVAQLVRAVDRQLGSVTVRYAISREKIELIRVGPFSMYRM